MFDLEGGWNISFAGCGFLGVYHIGVASCFLEQAPYLIKGATKIYGASAGALTAAVLTSGASIAQCCEDVMKVASQARKRSLGPLHPTFKLVRIIQDGLNRDLPADAHLRVAPKLCVSLTRVSDGENVLVSEFNSKEELIQALICSCFIPIYCGLIPPSYRGVRYVDGGISNNLPRYEQRNTITISPFSGESDICPKDNSTNFHELRVTNTSIQINLGNMYRLSKALFPPEPKVLAEMCQNGYKDTFRFLMENNLLRIGHPSAGLCQHSESKLLAPACCCLGVKSSQAVVMESIKDWVLQRLHLFRKRHWWLDEKIVDKLPPHLKKVFCDACREKHGFFAQMTDLLPVRVASYMLLPYTLPVESAYSVAQRLVEWIPDVSTDVRWLCAVAKDVYKQTRKWTSLDMASDASLKKTVSLPPSLEKDGALQLSFTDPPPSHWNSTSALPQTSSPTLFTGLRTHTPTSQPVSFFVGSEEDSDGFLT